MEEKEEISKSVILENKLNEEKEKWNKTISDVVKMIRHVDNISECQVLMLSYRHQLVDKVVEMKNIIGRQKGKLWETKKTTYRKYKTSYDLKLNQGEINDFIEADLKEDILSINILENQLSYYQMTIDTLDKLGFAISNKVTLSIKF